MVWSTETLHEAVMAVYEEIQLFYLVNRFSLAGKLKGGSNPAAALGDRSTQVKMEKFQKRL